MPNNEEKKPGFVNDAQGLFRKLNGKIEAHRAQGKMTADEVPDFPVPPSEEEDQDIPYSPMVDMPIPMPPQL